MLAYEHIKFLNRNLIIVIFKKYLQTFALSFKRGPVAQLQGV